MDGVLAGCTALVTGGGRGFGREIAVGLARAGARVGVVSRTPAELDETVRLVRDAGAPAAAAQADLSRETEATAAVAAIRSELGSVDLLVNNAGMTGPMEFFAGGDVAAWWRTMEVNLASAVYCSRQVLPEMVWRGRGRIVNITSQAGVFRWPTASAYLVSKAALVKYTENLAVEVRRHGVRVFSFDPGLLPIGFTAAAVARAPHAAGEEARITEWLLRERAEGRGAETEEAVQGVLALAAGRADALSGRHLSVHDDLDNLVRNATVVVDADLHVLRVNRDRDPAG